MSRTFAVSAQDARRSHYTVCAIICSECGEGNFLRVSDTLARCSECASEVTPRDIVDQLEEGESVRFIGAGEVLSVVVVW